MNDCSGALVQSGNASSLVDHSAGMCMSQASMTVSLRMCTHHAMRDQKKWRIGAVALAVATVVSYAHLIHEMILSKSAAGNRQSVCTKAE
jgi:sensor histidine kinase regulating citrate/malate metabolism